MEMELIPPNFHAEPPTLLPLVSRSDKEQNLFAIPPSAPSPKPPIASVASLIAESALLKQKDTNKPPLNVSSHVFFPPSEIADYKIFHSSSGQLFHVHRFVLFKECTLISSSTNSTEITLPSSFSASPDELTVFLHYLYKQCMSQPIEISHTAGSNPAGSKEATKNTLIPSAISCKTETLLYIAQYFGCSSLLLRIDNFLTQQYESSLKKGEGEVGTAAFLADALLLGQDYGLQAFLHIVIDSILDQHPNFLSVKEFKNLISQLTVETLRLFLEVVSERNSNSLVSEQKSNEDR